MYWLKSLKSLRKVVRKPCGFMDVSTGGVYSLDAAGDLIISGAMTTMSGYQYQAVFTNSSGSVTTNAVTLDVALIITSTDLTDYGPIPSNTAQPINLTVAVSGGVPDGEVVTIEDASNGNAVVPTTGNTLAGGSATLTIAAGALSTGTHNLFAVYGGDGTFAGSQSSMLSQAVNPAPMITITSQPANQIVNTGSTATFTAAASGNPAPTVKWQQSSDGGSTWAVISGATSATLTLANVSSSQNGDEYRAVFTNSVGGATSNAATLTVSAVAAPILATISTQTVDVGQTLQLDVSNYASDPNSPALPLSYRLVGGTPAGANIDPSTGIMTWAVGANQQIGTYAVTVLVSDNGSPQRTASETINLNVVDPRPVTVLSAQVTTKKGFAITLKLSGPVNPATAVNSSNYILTEPAKKPKSKKKPTAPPTRIKLSATYNQATNQVILKGPKTVKTSPALTLTVVGTGQSGIAKLDGLHLAGSGGLPGTNYVAAVTTKAIRPTAAVAGTMTAVRTGAQSANGHMDINGAWMLRSVRHHEGLAHRVEVASAHPAGPIAMVRAPAKVRTGQCANGSAGKTMSWISAWKSWRVRSSLKSTFVTTQSTSRKPAAMARRNVSTARSANA